MSAPLKLALFSGSQGFTRHVGAVLGAGVSIQALHASVQRLPAGVRQCDLAIIHSNSQREYLVETIDRLRTEGIAIAVAADVPNLDELLRLSRHQIRAYFNSYMADVHYLQMVSMAQAGQTWISPPLMAGALALARGTVQDDDEEDVRLESVLEPLTNRERQIARDVAEGKTNREIAESRHIAERTVKSHLTHIFKKLGTRNRQALTLRIRGANPSATKTARSASRQTH